MCVSAPTASRSASRSAIATSAPVATQGDCQSASSNHRNCFERTGAQPLRINTVYQLLADPASGIDTAAPWVSLPEYVLYWLGGRRVAEYTNATHTGLVDLKTGDWAHDLFELFGIPLEAAPPIVPAGTVVGRVKGPLAALDAFRETQLIAPACHDTASAIAGIPVNLEFHRLHLLRHVVARGHSHHHAHHPA